MRNIILGGEGFVGSYIEKKLMEDGNEVIVEDIVKRDIENYGDEKLVNKDVKEKEQIRKIGIREDEMVYNIQEKMIQKIKVREKRNDLLLKVKY